MAVTNDLLRRHLNTIPRPHKEICLDTGECDLLISGQVAGHYTKWSQGEASIATYMLHRLRGKIASHAFHETM